MNKPSEHGYWYIQKDGRWVPVEVTIDLLVFIPGFTDSFSISQIESNGFEFLDKIPEPKVVSMEETE